MDEGCLYGDLSAVPAVITATQVLTLGLLSIIIDAKLAKLVDSSHIRTN